MNITDKKFLRLQKWNDFVGGETQGFISNYAYNPIIARNKAGGQAYEFTEHIQESTKQDPNIVYAVPPHYTKNFDSRLWEFDIKFPQFSLPNGKYVFIDTTNDVRSNEGMLTRGVTLAKNSSKAIGFIDDKFLTDTGCPTRAAAFNDPAGAATQLTNWVNSKTQGELNGYAVNAVAPFASYEAVMFNWECIEQNISPDKEHPKLLNMLSNLKTVYPNIKFSCWNVGAVGMGRNSYQSGETITVGNKYLATSGVLDYLYCGGYLNFPTDYGFIHHYLREYLRAKELVASKPTLWTFWDVFEYVDGYFVPRACSPRERLTDANPNLDYIWYNKAAIFNQAMYNAGVWSVAVGDGIHLWNDWTNSDDPLAPPFGSVLNGNPISQVAGKMYARNDMKNIDWMMRGIYGVSKHANIINDNSGSWKFSGVSSTNFAANIDDSMLNKKPLIAYKKTNSGTLILAYRWYAPEDQKTTVNVTIDGNTYPVEVVGTWTTIKAV